MVFFKDVCKNIMCVILFCELGGEIAEYFALNMYRKQVIFIDRLMARPGSFIRVSSTSNNIERQYSHTHKYNKSGSWYAGKEAVLLWQLNKT